MEKVTIQIVEDHELVGDALKTRLEKEPEFNVVAISHTENKAVADAFSFKPNIILMDINLKEGNGIQASSRILERLKDSSKIIGVSVHLDLAHIKRILEIGAYGYVTKGSPIEELIDAILTVHKTDVKYICKEVVDKFDFKNEKSKENKLSKREIEIISHLNMHKSSSEIADFLDISRRTIDTHLYNARKKLNAKKTTDLIRIALELGYKL